MWSLNWNWGFRNIWGFKLCSGEKKNQKSNQNYKTVQIRIFFAVETPWSLTQNHNITFSFQILKSSQPWTPQSCFKLLWLFILVSTSRCAPSGWTGSILMYKMLGGGFWVIFFPPPQMHLLFFFCLHVFGGGFSKHTRSSALDDDGYVLGSPGPPVFKILISTLFSSFMYQNTVTALLFIFHLQIWRNCSRKQSYRLFWFPKRPRPQTHMWPCTQWKR